MHRRLVLFAAGPVLAGLLLVACTQSFGVFEGTGAAGGSGSSTATGTGGAGGATSSSSSTSSSTSASSSSTTSSSTSASTSASSTTSSSGGGPEQCTNGVDDDGNGLTDCADPACAAYSCVGSAPASWTGPVVLYDGDPALVPACPPEHPMMAYQGHGDLVPEPAVCGACTCAAPPATCAPKALTLGGDAACGSTVGTLVQPAVGQCLDVAPPAGTMAFSAAAPGASAGACTPSGGGKAVPPAKWQRGGLTCLGGGLGLGCGGGSFCTATPVAPFVAGLCVQRSGDHQCPGGFPVKHSFSDSVVDTRDCTGCSCGVAAASCAVQSKLYPGAQCAGTPVAVPNDGSCVPGPGGAASISISVTASASCPPAGGQPTGTIAEGSGQTTVCCTM